MDYTIDARRVAGIVKEISQAVSGKGWNYAELIIGLSEMTGRVVVMAAENPMQTDQLTAVAARHLAHTIAIGAQASEKNLIERI